MLAIQLHRWRKNGPRSRTDFVKVVAVLSAIGCGLGVALLQAF